MKQRASIIMIGVDNLEAMKQFYIEKFEWQIEAQASDIIFFKLNGFLFGLYGRKNLANFVGTTGERSGFKPYLLAYMVSSKLIVKQLYKQLKTRGVQIIGEPEESSFGGYYFLIADVEENVWEIAYNPFIKLDKKGNVVAHQNIDKL
ncbi:VOC family protein [Chryseobacterium chendengshani]|uniref:VOC family protein n=1 Tax=Chryseobacterium sp. LJ668 TaxID=2864040 RepID=UPI001C68DA4D|nr:VOC family protein [Chryseobacterium sp. LJ668]MBW8523856.1 VOC family protein [Chryseobacterium sp. LJ668]QYK16799.1 VOC family protein [Chryseobacterium sp. LJ668]